MHQLLRPDTKVTPALRIAKKKKEKEKEKQTDSPSTEKSGQK